MKTLIPVNQTKDIPSAYAGNPIGELLSYHNLEAPLKSCAKPRLLIGMCMDYRKHLRIPRNFAYVVRAAGANLKHSEFGVSFAIAAGGVSFIALIGHDGCGMSGLKAKKDVFVEGLVRNGGWEKKAAEKHFEDSVPAAEVGEETDFVLSETRRLRGRYPKITIAPLLYKLQDNRLYFISES